jgi:hypothetical protein
MVLKRKVIHREELLQTVECPADGDLALVLRRYLLLSGMNIWMPSPARSNFSKTARYKLESSSMH